MAFNLQEVVSELNRGGLMRTSKLEMTFPPPTAFAAYKVRGSEDLAATNGRLRFWCEGANVPGVALATEDIKRYGYGPSEKKPFAPIFTDLQLTFRGDAEGKIWDYLHAWQRIACLYESTTAGQNAVLSTAIGSVPGQLPYEISYKGDYMVDATLTVYDDAGNPGIATMFREAYPIFVGDTPLNWGARDEYMRIPVTMTYFDWFSLRPGAIAATNLPTPPG